MVPQIMNDILNSNCKMYIDSPVASTSEMLNRMNVVVCYSTHA